MAEWERGRFDVTKFAWLDLPDSQFLEKDLKRACCCVELTSTAYPPFACVGMSYAMLFGLQSKLFKVYIKAQPLQIHAVSQTQVQGAAALKAYADSHELW